MVIAFLWTTEANQNKPDKLMHMTSAFWKFEDFGAPPHISSLHSLSHSTLNYNNNNMSSSSVPSPAAMSAHRDVLEAPIPETPKDKAKLVDELKNRGRAAVGAKSWRDASLLYKKATEVTPDDAILFSNLALTQINMGMYEAARVNAETSTTLDPTYLKGFWRLGQALDKLKRTSEALEAMQTALKLDSTNKALQKEVTRLQQQVQEEEELMKMDVDTSEQDNKMRVDLPPAVKPPKTTTTTTTKSSTTKKPQVSLSTVAEDDDGTFTKSDHVKGYKIVNGKKTSYFHRELTEEEKQMIGDIAPKRIDASSGDAEMSNAPQLLQPADGASAWNKAGTWEERDVSSWAQDTLKAALSCTSYTLPDSSPAPGAVAKVTAVPKLNGHASYATVRGKKKYIYEFLIELKWEFVHDSEKGSGSMSFPDFDGTCEIGEGYEMLNYHVDPETPSALRPVLDRFVKNDGLRDALHDTLDDWVRLFKETY